MARFAYALVNGGQAYGTRLFRRTTLERFVEPVRLRSTYPTGLGWMVNAGDGNSAAGREFGPRSFGHTGYTGTSIWVDPDQGLFVVLLSNRVHPSRNNRRIRDVRPALADAVAGAVAAPPGRPERGWGLGPVPRRPPLRRLPIAMPTYTYRRPDGTTFDAFQKMSDPPLTEDPETGVPVTRMISGGAGLQFKGSGFYLTDYVKKSGTPDKAESGGSSDKAPNTSPKKETKPDAPSTPAASGAKTDAGT